MKSNSFKFQILIIILGVLGIISAVNAQGIPCDTRSRGLIYTGAKHNYTPVLNSTMPLDILYGYIIADSISTYSSLQYYYRQDIVDFLNSLSNTSDTLNYALKYMYRLADYNPILFYNFTMGVPAPVPFLTQSPKRAMEIVERDINERVYKGGCVDNFCKKIMLLHPHYILHIKVLDTQTVHYKSPGAGDSVHLMEAYCIVIDRIKGQVIPALEDGFIVTETDSITPINTPLTAKLSGTSSGSSVAIPNYTSNLAFEYNIRWTRENGKAVKPMFDQAGNHWIQRDSEYIVSLRPGWLCGDPYTVETPGHPATKQYYYTLMPVGGDLSGGMFPIKNGNVIDEGNDWGWGTSVPLNVFKQNLHNAINVIKNYGE